MDKGKVEVYRYTCWTIAGLAALVAVVMLAMNCITTATEQFTTCVEAGHLPAECSASQRR